MNWLWHHPEEANKMGEAAQRRYKTYFTADKMVSSYCDLYKGLLDI
jgi:rhamnosyl/mannosyltransferase